MRALALFLLGTLAQSRDSQTVVFVCEHGTVKSVVAMAWFARLARERHLPIRAISRGTALEPGIPKSVLAGLTGDGFQLGGFLPTRFTEADVAGAITVISLDEPSVAGRVAGKVPTQAWDGLPSVTQNYSMARDSIQRRVRALIDSLARRSKGP